MEIVTDRAGWQARAQGEPVCVLADPADDGLLAALGPVLPPARVMRTALESRRPLVHAEDGTIAVLVIVADGWDARKRVLLLATGDHLVVLTDPASRELVRQAVGPAHTPAHGLVKALAAVARAAEADLDAVSDAEADTEVGLRPDRLIPDDLRRTAGAKRARLFEWRQLYAGQARLLDDDEPLAEALDEDAARFLRAPRSSFGYAADVADRLHAVLGDLLAQQDALASQRLTLVSTVFLPLTVTTGFFGMNFEWLTDRVGSPGAFVVFGLLVPALAVLVSVAAVRRFGV